MNSFQVRQALSPWSCLLHSIASPLRWLPLLLAALPCSASVTVTIYPRTIIGTSNFMPGCTYNQDCPDLSGHNATAVAAAKVLLEDSCPVQNAQMIGWGMPDPQPNGSPQNMAANWSALNTRLQFIVASGGTPVITFCEAPAWMVVGGVLDPSKAPEDSQSGDPHNYVSSAESMGELRFG